MPVSNDEKITHPENNFYKELNNQYVNFFKNVNKKVPFPPFSIDIEPTNHCNLRCITCVGENMTRKKGYMTEETHKRIIDSLVQHDWMIRLSYVGFGEPVLHPKIFDFIRYASDNGLSSLITTNLTFLNDAAIERFFDSGLSFFTCAFYTLQKKQYEFIKQGSDYFHDLKMFLSLIEKNEKKGHPLKIGVALLDSKLVHDLGETYDFFSVQPIDLLKVCLPSGFVTDAGIYDEVESKIDKNQYDICCIPFSNIKISWNGDVSLCPMDCNDRYIIGNVNEETIMSMWNNDKSLAFREAVINHDVDFFKRTGLRCDLCNSSYDPLITLKRYQS